jgi:hypothetical protein
LVCSRYGQTIREAAKSAVEYLKSIKQWIYEVKNGK